MTTWMRPAWRSRKSLVMQPRKDYEGREKKLLAPYAQLSSASLGREYHEAECPFRTCFRRDLARIIHSTAFRLLEYKTQVFVNHEGDYYRTRLTHSLEVSQIAGGLARILRLNEDLAQTIALAHDLGHAPFGHSGEVALDTLVKSEGGFEHNYQSFRVVTRLEERYPDFPGLNLSYEVLEGILAHATEYDTPMRPKDFKCVGHPTLEAQVVNRADEIAFMNHDLDDGLHWGMLTMKSLKDVPLWYETYKEIEKDIPSAPDRIKRCRAISNLINKLIVDLQGETKKRIVEHRIKTLKDVRDRGRDIVSFSKGMSGETREVKDFLFENVYRHPQVVKMAGKASEIITDLFRAYSKNPRAMPAKFYKRFETDKTKRHICDYIAGMTDRFALKEHKKLFD